VSDADTGQTTTGKYADRINKLIAKANATEHQEEADAFLAKAQELMTQHAITELMLAELRGVETQESITTDRLWFTGMFNELVMHLAFTAMRYNDCRGHYTDYQKRGIRVTFVGYESDIERAKLLTASLQLQCASALRRWWKNHPDKHYMSGWEKVKERRSFITGYDLGVSNKLAEGARAGREAATRDEAERAGTSVADATTSVSLVLRSRRDTVKDWYDERYGGTVKSSSSRQQNGSMSAMSEGMAAGRQADTNAPRVGGDRGALRG
jgi:hypothetical protein